MSLHKVNTKCLQRQIFYMVMLYLRYRFDIPGSLYEACISVMSIFLRKKDKYTYRCRVYIVGLPLPQTSVPKGFLRLIKMCTFEGVQCCKVGIQKMCELQTKINVHRMH